MTLKHLPAYLPQIWFRGCRCKSRCYAQQPALETWDGRILSMLLFLVRNRHTLIFLRSPNSSSSHFAFDVGFLRVYQHELHFIFFHFFHALHFSSFFFFSSFFLHFSSFCFSFSFSGLLEILFFGLNCFKNSCNISFQKNIFLSRLGVYLFGSSFPLFLLSVFPFFSLILLSFSLFIFLKK